MPTEIQRPIEILLVEDNPGDILLTEEAFADAKVDLRIRSLTDGAEAVASLESAAADPDGRLPDLVLLDLNLPGIDGHGVLRAIREHDDLCHLPVIIMTSSSAEQDVVKAYRGSANAYITKPLDTDEFLVVIRSLEQFWLSIVQLPRADP